ncbi:MULTISPECIES: GNAT family N-acetyltransferase [Paenibacillus]|uniref:GNAT family N-acetyltransferase n=1 Tax=Paenibacillus TaxID=44249 RepID=UPI0022B8BA9E|nr:GNAT family N-acetyltransferase [Paenibacillus caseinilyticus]MCZ8521098.1 GNAT family N-acetyltransferase [Paenibacillus caseinilyticus]
MIAPVRREEIGLVYEIMQEAFKEYRGVLQPPSGALGEKPEDLLPYLEGGGGAVLAWDGCAAVGSARYKKEADFLYIGRVSVLPAYRRRGLGAALLQHLEGVAVGLGYRRSRVGVRLSIPGNVAYYERLGYAVIERHEYPCGRDSWVIMSKELDLAGHSGQQRGALPQG